MKKTEKVRNKIWLKVVSVVIIQAFILFDLQWAYGGSLFTGNYANKTKQSTLSPRINITNVFLQGAFNKLQRLEKEKVKKLNDILISDSSAPLTKLNSPIIRRIEKFISSTISPIVRRLYKSPVLGATAVFIFAFIFGASALAKIFLVSVIVPLVLAGISSYLVFRSSPRIKQAIGGFLVFMFSLFLVPDNVYSKLKSEIAEQVKEDNFYLNTNGYKVRATHLNNPDQGIIMVEDSVYKYLRAYLNKKTGLITLKEASVQNDGQIRFVGKTIKLLPGDEGYNEALNKMLSSLDGYYQYFNLQPVVFGLIQYMAAQNPENNFYLDTPVYKIGATNLDDINSGFIYLIDSTFPQKLSLSINKENGMILKYTENQRIEIMPDDEGYKNEINTILESLNNYYKYFNLEPIVFSVIQMAENYNPTDNYYLNKQNLKTGANSVYEPNHGFIFIEGDNISMSLNKNTKVIFEYTDTGRDEYSPGDAGYFEAFEKILNTLMDTYTNQVKEFYKGDERLLYLIGYLRDVMNPGLESFRDWTMYTSLNVVESNDGVITEIDYRTYRHAYIFFIDTQVIRDIGYTGTEEFTPNDPGYIDALSRMIKSIHVWYDSLGAADYAIDKRVIDVIRYLMDIRNQLAPENTIDGYYWGYIGSNEVVTVEEIYYFPGELNSHRRERTVKVENKFLGVKVAYQHIVGYENPRYENIYVEKYTINLEHGAISTPGGLVVVPLHQGQYIPTINEILSLVRVQERSESNSISKKKLQEVVEYLANIKGEMGVSKYYWNEAGLPKMDINIKKEDTVVRVINDWLTVNDYADYESYSLDLLTGIIIPGVIGQGKEIIAPNDLRYWQMLNRISILVEDAYNSSKEQSEERRKLKEVIDYLQNITHPDLYYWGYIGDSEVVTYEEIYYFPGELNGQRRERIVKIEDKKLQVETGYQHIVGYEEPHYEDIYRQIHKMDLVNGTIITAEGEGIIPEQGEKYIIAVNKILSLVRIQEGAEFDEGKDSKLRNIIDYLVSVKEKMGASKYYWNSGLPKMNIIIENGRFSVKVENERLIVNDSLSYRSYSLDLFTGDIIRSVAGLGTEIFAPDAAEYLQSIEGILEIIEDAYNAEANPNNKEQINKVRVYVTKIQDKVSRGDIAQLILGRLTSINKSGILSIQMPTAHAENKDNQQNKVELTGELIIHNFAGGGGSGSLMSGPPIYLDTEKGRYVIRNPSAYYLDPLWQKLLPLKGKTVTLKGNITEISPFSGYDGYLENVSIVAEDSEIENAEVTVSKAYIYSKVERDAKNITVAFYQFTLHTSPITIDRKTGIISYNLPKGSSLKTILTPQGEIRYERNGVPIPGDNKKDLNQYRTELEKMIRWADKILKMKTDKPLSEQDRDFIESVIKELIQIGSRVKNRTKSEALDKLGNVVPIEKLQPQIGSTLSVQYLLQQSI